MSDLNDLDINIIPVDDIMDFYINADAHTKKAVSELLSGRQFIGGFSDEPEDGTTDLYIRVIWHADAKLSTRIIAAFLSFGLRSFGHTWWRVVRSCTWQKK